MTKKKTSKPSSKATKTVKKASTTKAVKSTEKTPVKTAAKSAPKAAPKTTAPISKKSESVFGKRESSILLFIVVLACLIFAGWGNPDHPFGFGAKTSDDSSGSGKALIGGAFELTDQNGNKFSSAQLKGKKSLVFFGFTNCPSICPTTLAQLTVVMEKLDANKIQPVFITVDPDRDTPEVIKSYLASFYPSFIGLTGSAEDLENVRKAYKVYSNKVDEGAEAKADEYIMDHSGLVYVMDENGEYLAHFSGAESAQEMVAKINSL